MKMVEDEGTNLEEFVIGRGEPAIVLPRPLELLAQHGIELDVEFRRSGKRQIRCYTYSDPELTSHVGPLPRQHLHLKFNAASRGHTESPPTILYGEFLVFAFASIEGVAIHSVSGTMPRFKYQTIGLEDYYRRLNEIRATRVGGVG